MERNRVFYLERDFYSNPQVVLVVARSPEEANKMLDEQLDKENYEHGEFGDLTELDIQNPDLTILSPPGDRHFIR